MILALPLAAAELDGTAWYAADGELVFVEGADAEPAEVPFVAEWRKREIARRERVFDPYDQPFNSGRNVWSGYGASPWGWAIRSNSFSRYRAYAPRYGSGFVRSCPTPYRGGASVIIRW